MTNTNAIKRGPGRPRADERDARDEAVLEAAGAAFLEHGYAQASMEEIARRAGASKQTLYARYPSKAALFAAVMRRRSEGLVGALASAMLHDDASASEVLYRYGVQVLRANLSEEGRRLQRLLVAEAPASPDLAAAFWQNGPGLGRDLVERYLESLARRGAFPLGCAARAADHFMSLVFGWVMLRSSFQLPPAFETDDALEEWVRGAVDIFLRAYSSQEASEKEMENKTMADEKRYTVEQAAAEVGFRADDLVATLPDAGIDLSAPGHEGNTLSAEEVARLSHWVTQIKQLHDNAPADGV